MRNKVTDPTVASSQAENVLRLAADLAVTPPHSDIARVIDLFAVSLDQPSLAETAMCELGRIPQAEAVELLKGALKKYPVTPQARNIIAREWTPQAKTLFINEPLSARPVTPTIRLSAGGESSQTLSESTWQFLLKRIRDGRCVPIIGANRARSEIASKLAHLVRYPFPDPGDLARVADYAATIEDTEWTARTVTELLTVTKDHDDNVYRALASLPFPLYITTSFDSGLEKALAEKALSPDVFVCSYVTSHTNEQARNRAPGHALVVHLYGHVTITQSMAIASFQLLRWLKVMSEDHDRIPIEIRRALATSVLLFLDFEAGSLELGAILEAFAQYTELNRRTGHIGVPSSSGAPQDPAIRSYQQQYFTQRLIGVVAGAVDAFTAELNTRWEEFSHASL